MTRLGFAVSRPQARQYITHGHIAINGRKLIASYLVRPGDQIQVKNREHSRKLVADNLAAGGGPPLPEWLDRISTSPPQEEGASEPPSRRAGCRPARDAPVDHRVSLSR